MPKKIVNVDQCIYLKVRTIINRYLIINIVEKIFDKKNDKNDCFHSKINNFFEFSIFLSKNFTGYFQDIIFP